MSGENEFYVIENLHIQKDAALEPSVRQAYESILLPLINPELVHCVYGHRFAIKLLSIGTSPSSFSPAVLISVPCLKLKRRAFAHLAGLADLRAALKEQQLALHIIVDPAIPSGDLTCEVEDRMEAPYLVFPRNSRALCRSKIIIPKSNATSSSECVSGPTFNVDGRLYAKTALHPWEDNDDSGSGSVSDPVTSESEDDESHDGLALSLYPDDQNSPDDFEPGANFALVSPCVCPRVGSDQDDMHSADERHYSGEESYGHVKPAFWGPRTDWLLYDALEAAPQIPNNELSGNEVDGHVITKFHNEDPDAKIAVTVADHQGIVHGVIQPGKVLFRSGARNYDLRLVMLESPLSLGCSGAAVTHMDELCGTIIAISQKLPWAYMSPIQAELEELRAVCGPSVCLSNPKDREIMVKEAATCNNAQSQENQRSERSLEVCLDSGYQTMKNSFEEDKPSSYSSKRSDMYFAEQDFTGRLMKLQWWSRRWVWQEIVLVKRSMKYLPSPGPWLDADEFAPDEIHRSSSPEVIHDIASNVNFIKWAIEQSRWMRNRDDNTGHITRLTDDSVLTRHDNVSRALSRWGHDQDNPHDIKFENERMFVLLLLGLARIRNSGAYEYFALVFNMWIIITFGRLDIRDLRENDVSLPFEGRHKADLNSVSTDVEANDLMKSIVNVIFQAVFESNGYCMLSHCWGNTSPSPAQGSGFVLSHPIPMLKLFHYRNLTSAPAVSSTMKNGYHAYHSIMYTSQLNKKGSLTPHAREMSQLSGEIRRYHHHISTLVLLGGFASPTGTQKLLNSRGGRLEPGELSLIFPRSERDLLVGQATASTKPKNFFTRGYKCSELGCRKSYVRKGDLIRHRMKFHGVQPKFHCPIRDCHAGRGGRGFCRMHRLVELLTEDLSDSEKSKEGDERHHYREHPRLFNKIDAT